jgi:hypothetical protein
MFEHRRFGLEQAVIARLKENTRRRVRFQKGVNDEDVESAVMSIDEKGRVYFTFSVATHQGTESVDVYPKYQIGEQVAIAQSYENIPMEHFLNGIDDPMKRYFQEQLVKQAAAYKNKLFAVASLMPHVIEITDIKAERLQDISNEDCLKEGITTITEGKREPGNGYGWDPHCAAYDRATFFTPRTAFAALIDGLNGRGTWERNEWQFAYTFKLIK